MEDIIMLLAEILKISPDLVYKYSAQGPINALFFLFFLPTIFLLVFLYIGISNITTHRGLNLLISIAVYIFIIVEGLYPLVINLGLLWIVIIIIIGFFSLFRHHRERAPQPRERIFSSLGRKFGEQMWRNMTIKKDYERILDSQLRELRALREEARKGSGDALRAFGDLEPQARATLMKLHEIENIGGIKFGRSFDKKMREFKEIIEEMEKMSGV